MSFATLWLLLLPFLVRIDANNLLSSTTSQQLITQDESGYLHINESIANSLSQINASIGVVSIVGPYRSGKSYLLNQLIDPSSNILQPFGIGSTVQPHSKGVSIFAYQNENDIRLKIENEYQNDEFPDIILFVDTVGLFAPHHNEQSDARIVALSSLISSVLIFNHMNIMDSQEIDRFNFIIQYSTAVLPNNEVDQNIDWKTFQPDLLWIVRDFYLQLKNDRNENIPENEWLNNVLSETTDGLKLYDFFNSINLFTMPRPTKNHDDELLQDITEHPKDTNKHFKIQLAKIRNKIFNTIKCKTLDGRNSINGKMLADLINVFVRRLNSDRGMNSVRTMKTLVAAVKSRMITRLFNQYKSSFEKWIISNADGEASCNDELSCDILQYLPIKYDRLADKHVQILSGIMNKLDNELYNYYNMDENEISENKAILSHKISKWYDQFLLKENEKLISNVIQRKFFALVEVYQHWFDHSEKKYNPSLGTNEQFLKSFYGYKKLISEYRSFISQYKDIENEDVKYASDTVNKLKNEFNLILALKLSSIQLQYKKAEQQCKDALASIKLQYNDRYITDTFSSIESLKKDLYEAETKFYRSCKDHEAQQLFEQFFRECIGILTDYIHSNENQPEMSDAILGVFIIAFVILWYLYSRILGLIVLVCGFVIFWGIRWIMFGEGISSDATDYDDSGHTFFTFTFKMLMFFVTISFAGAACTGNKCCRLCLSLSAGWTMSYFILWIFGGLCYFTYIERATPYSFYATQERCLLLSSVERSCTYKCNCVVFNIWCDRCKGINYVYTARAFGKCGYTILRSDHIVEDIKCPQEPKTVNEKHSCWIKSCNDQVLLTSPGSIIWTSLIGIIVLTITINCVCGCFGPRQQ